MAVLTLSKAGGEWSREIAFALAVLLIAATAPAFCRPMVDDSVPTLTVDICHPLQSIGSAAQIVVGATPGRWDGLAPAVRTFKPRRKIQLTARLNDRPDTPPPKTAA